jgi:hypothetical protein
MEGRGWGIQGGAWVWRRSLFAWEEDSVRECSVLLHNFVLQDFVLDTWRWALDPTHGYTVRGAYRLITTTGEMVDMSLVDEVWHRHIPSKVSLLAWRLLRNRLPTRDNLMRRGVIPPSDMLCVVGCDCTESATHLFLLCTLSADLWALVLNWLDIYFVHDGQLRHHFLQFTKMAGMPFSTQVFFRIIWFVTIWVLWRERNNRIFQTTVSSPIILIEKVKLHSFLWLKSKQVAFAYTFNDWWRHPTLCMGVLL